MKPRQMAFVSQIGREPGQKKDQRGIAGKLPKTGADNLPTAEQAFSIAPVKWNVLGFIVNLAGANIIQLGFICRC